MPALRETRSRRDSLAKPKKNNRTIEEEDVENDDQDDDDEEEEEEEAPSALRLHWSARPGATVEPICGGANRTLRPSSGGPRRGRRIVFGFQPRRGLYLVLFFFGSFTEIRLPSISSEN